VENEARLGLRGRGNCGLLSWATRMLGFFFALLRFSRLSVRLRLINGNSSLFFLSIVDSFVELAGPNIGL
jgi:hypothetical protein